MLITVPYGQPEDLGWLRQFDAPGLDRLVALSRGEPTETTIFQYTPEGWRHSSRERAAGASYHMIDRKSPAAGPDGAIAARAVACLDIRLP